MGTYRSFDKNDCMYFMIKEEKVFIEYNNIWRKVDNVIKQFIKSENKINTKEGFQYFYISVILIDSVYIKDENYYSKLFIQKYNFNKDIEIYSNNFILFRL